MTNDGGPAFPVPDSADPDGPWIEGISVADYFAAHATDGDVACALEELGRRNEHRANVRARARYLHADAMLAERARRYGSERKETNPQ